MATKRIKKSVDEDELGYAAERATACQGDLLITRLEPRSPDKCRDSEESELAEAGHVRLPVESLPNSFWGMPAPQVSFADAVDAVTSERRKLMP